MRYNYKQLLSLAFILYSFILIKNKTKSKVCFHCISSMHQGILQTEEIEAHLLTITFNLGCMTDIIITLAYLN